MEHKQYTLVGQIISHGAWVNNSEITVHAPMLNK